MQRVRTEVAQMMNADDVQVHKNGGKEELNCGTRACG